MSLDSFAVSRTADGNTRCVIYVDVRDRSCDVTVTINGLIVRQADESDPCFRSVTDAEFANPAFWDDRAAVIAVAQSPFWHSRRAA